MEPLAAGLDADDHHSTELRPEFDRVVAGLDFEIGHSVEDGPRPELTVLHAHGRCCVSIPSMRKLFCVILLAGALKAVSRSRLAVAGVTPARSGELEVAAVERQPRISLLFERLWRGEDVSA